MHRFAPASHLARLLLFVSLLLGHAAVQAQITPKPDGVFRSLWGLSGSASEGNTRATTITATSEAVRQTDESKWGLYGRANYARGDGGTTASNIALGTQYDRNLSNKTWFAFGKLDTLRDRPANVASRVSAYGGLGRHMIHTNANNLDLFGGLGYTADHYVQPAEVAGDFRQNYGRTEAVLSETSNHTLTPSTTVRQKLEIYPNLRTQGDFRTVLELGLAVAITDRMQLTTGLLHRYDNDPGTGIKHSDALFTTGISVRFE